MSFTVFFFSSCLIFIFSILFFSKSIIENKVINPYNFIFISTFILLFPISFKNFIQSNNNVAIFYFKYLHFNDIFTTYYTIVSVIINALVLWFYLWSFRQSLKNNKLDNLPIITLKPTFNQDGLIYINLKNSGKTPAYNLSITFDDLIPYKDSPYKFLNNLPLFNNLSFLDASDCITFFYDGAYDFFSKDPMRENWEVKITLTYEIDYFLETKEKITRNSVFSFKETSGICYVKTNNLGNISKELNELKHAIVLNALKKEVE